jgi:hypothetical protein
VENHKLTKEELEIVAKRASELAYDRFYLAVGKSVAKQILWILGAAAVAAWYFISGGPVPK